MRRAVLLSLLLLAPARADEDVRRGALRELQARIERATREAGPSIACIYVSRSDAYHTARYWGSTARREHAGQLGRFDAAAARKAVPADARHRERILRTIDDHDLSNPAAVPESYGSGFVIDRIGQVLTNAHVVRNATKIYVRFGDRRGSWADIHACDPRSDLAVLELLDPPADLKALELGEGGKVRTGQFVLSLVKAWSPRLVAEGPTVSAGLVSQLNRPVDPKKNVSEMERSKVTLHHYGTLIQTDAQTTPGCSGAVLLDLAGKVVGLTTALAGVSSDRPGGFAIPFNADTRKIVEVLKRGEEVEYAFLGVNMPDPRFGMDRDGVRIGGVVRGMPAERAGIHAGDVIVSINGEAVRKNEDLFLLIGRCLAGSVARVGVQRAGGVHVFTVKLAKIFVEGSVIASKRPTARFGLRVDHTSILCQRNPFFFGRWSRPTPEGVVIREVEPDSPADRARLQPDKVITEVNGRRVTSPVEYYREMARAGKRVELTYLSSDGRATRLTLEEKEKKD
jgi:serine protease Do